MFIGGGVALMRSRSAAIAGLHVVERESQQLAEKGNGGRLIMFSTCNGEYNLIDDWLVYVGGGEGPWPHENDNQ
jgi:hypothetical protein